MDFEGAFFDTEKFILTNKRLGKGAFGDVFIVKDKLDNKKYAAKIIDTHKVFTSQDQMMFLRESYILHKLSHPGIVKFYGINLHSFNNTTILQPTILTEYLKHGSLKAILDKEKRSIADGNWNSTKKFICLIGISNALRYLHEFGIFHRDLKPENILIDENYFPRVCDFGLSKCFSQSFSKSIRLSISGKVGTPLYMAPEIFKDGNKCGPSVDVYAFGMLAYEIFTGKEPFSECEHETNFLDLIQKISQGYQPEFDDKFPHKMKNLILRCLSYDPEKRPSFDEIYNELSKNITYSDYNDESVDEDEINQYIENLEEFMKEQSDKDQNNVLVKNEKLQEEIKRLKIECNQYHNLLNSLIISENDLILALHRLHGNKKEQKIVDAIKYLNKSSEKGNRYASYILGLLYENGEGVIKDFDIAKSFYIKSVNQGNSHGINRIGLYYNGNCEHEKDYKKAKEYYEKGMELGNLFSICNLGNLYLKGNGVKQDYLKAIELYKKAAEMGSSDAFNKLGNIYSKGIGVEQNIPLANEYYQKEKDIDNVTILEKKDKLYSFYKEYDDIAQEVKVPQLIYLIGWLYLNGGFKNGSSIALNYFQKAADLGVPEAFFEIGKLYGEGKEVNQNDSKALDYIIKATELGIPEAYCQLGWHYLNGKGVEKDYSKSFIYFKKAAKLNVPVAFYEIGWIYLEGKGVMQDYSKAISYYQKASEYGVPLSFYQLGWIYMELNGFPHDFKKAKAFFENAGEFGVPEAFYSLGCMFEEGRGVKQNFAQALMYYQKAANLGYSDANEKVVQLNINFQNRFMRFINIFNK